MLVELGWQKHALVLLSLGNRGLSATPTPMPAAVSWGAEAADFNKQLGHGLRLLHLILREHILHLREHILLCGATLSVRVKASRERERQRERDRERERERERERRRYMKFRGTETVWVR